MPNHNITPVEYFAIDPDAQILISRSWPYIKEAGTYQLFYYTSLEEELQRHPNSIVAIWKRKDKSQITR